MLTVVGVHCPLLSDFYKPAVVPFFTKTLSNLNEPALAIKKKLNSLCRWINCLIMAIQKHKKFNPDSEEGELSIKVT